MMEFAGVTCRTEPSCWNKSAGVTLLDDISGKYNICLFVVSFLSCLFVFVCLVVAVLVLFLFSINAL